MSNKNNRVKRLEKKVEKQVRELEDDVLRLDEENSNLRQLIDVREDYLKEQINLLKWDIEVHNNRFRFWRTQTLKLKETVEEEKDKLLKVTGAVADQGTDIEKAQERILGRFIFKKNRKER